MTAMFFFRLHGYKMNCMLVYMYAPTQMWIKMKQAKRTTMAVTAERKEKLEQIAIIKSMEERKKISWTDLVNELIDDFIEKTPIK